MNFNSVHKYEINRIRNICNNHQSKTKSTVVVYSANIGDYDKFTENIFLDDSIDYYLFTNSNVDKNKFNNVNVIRTNLDLGNPRLTAKFFKICPHDLFPHYEISVWIDSNCIQLSSFIPLINSISFKNSGISMFFHDKRNNYIEEAKECIRWSKDDTQVILNQINQYGKYKKINDYRLYHGRFILRYHNNKKIKILMNTWWLEINKHSIRDQISLPYSLYKNNIIPSAIEANITNNFFFKAIDHKKDLIFTNSYFLLLKYYIKSMLSKLYMRIKATL